MGVQFLTVQLSVQIFRNEANFLWSGSCLRTVYLGMQFVLEVLEELFCLFLCLPSFLFVWFWFCLLLDCILILLTCRLGVESMK